MAAPKVPQKRAIPVASPQARGPNGLVEIDLGRWGCETAEAAGWRLWRRPLKFPEALALANGLARLLGRDIADGLGKVFGGVGSVLDEEDERRAAFVRALAEGAGALVDQIAREDWDEWCVALFGIGQKDAVLHYSGGPVGVADSQPLPVIAGPGAEEDARDLIFEGAPLEALAVCAALAVEGVGPLPGLGWIRGAVRSSATPSADESKSAT